LLTCFRNGELAQFSPSTVGEEDHDNGVAEALEDESCIKKAMDRNIIMNRTYIYLISRYKCDNKL
jgi:hypothetical protein